MKETIHSNRMALEKEEARPGPDLASLPQERHVWRMPEFHPIPQGLCLQTLMWTLSLNLLKVIFLVLNHFQVATIEVYQSQYKKCYREAEEEEWEICPNLWQGAMNSYLHIKSFLVQEKNIELSGGWRPFSCKEKVKKIKNWLKNQSLSSIDQNKELEMTPALEKEGPVASTTSRNFQIQAQRTSEESEISQEPSGQGQR
ncbi:hypothetical protein O181_067228 [Austropuccinia psidii MF-1]|uniref:Uncharacterized protein n=1 Tax=Austropuccinia psidii MF-1 TaxID=1389203 RepID=A0A9Q3I4B6_9BASI|nr:hypothetical protein [Austropuccinia psidii MF-1]